MIILLFVFVSSITINPIPDYLSPPKSIVRSTAVYDEIGNQIITIGGFDLTTNESKDMIVSFNLTSRKFSTIIPASKFVFGVASGHGIFMGNNRKVISLGFMAGCYSFNLDSRIWKIEEFSGDTFPEIIDFGSTQYKFLDQNFIAIFGGQDIYNIKNDLYM